MRTETELTSSGSWSEVGSQKPSVQQGPPQAAEQHAPTAEETGRSRAEGEAHREGSHEQQGPQGQRVSRESEEDERSEYSSPGRSGKEDLIELVSLMARHQIESDLKHSALLQSLKDAQVETNRPKTRTEKPNLTAAYGEKLRLELKDFETYMNEIKISCRRAWIKYARLGAKGTAKTEMDSWIIEVFGNEAGWQKALLEEKPDNTYWQGKWESMVYRLKRSVSMDSEHGTNLAIAKMNEVKLVDSAGDPKKVQSFLETYIGCRAKFLEFGLTKSSNSKPSN